MTRADDKLPESVRALKQLADSRLALDTVNLKDVTSRQTPWLWPGRIPHARVCLIAGPPGAGKSFLSLDIAARVSAGAPWPDAPDIPTTPGNVLLMSAEDDAADTVYPRAVAAGADLNRIEFVLQKQEEVGGFTWDLDLFEDIDLFTRTIYKAMARLVIVDPLSAFMCRLNACSEGDVRALLHALAEVAERTQATIVLITHLNKRGGSGRATDRVQGSIALVAACRAAWLVDRDCADPERRLVLPIKNNLHAADTGLAFTIDNGRVVWSPEPVTRSTDEILAERPREALERGRAAEWLKEQLATGPVPVKELRAAARAEGLGWRTVERAKPVASVVARKQTEGSVTYWVWQLGSVPPGGSSRDECRRAGREDRQDRHDGDEDRHEASPQKPHS